MAVRLARAGDVERIKLLAESLRFDPTDPKPGALVAVLNREEYLARIEGSRYFYVDVDEGGLNGFLMCEDDGVVDALFRRGLFHHEEMLPFFAKQKRPFVYGESVGIKKGKQRRGIGRALMDKWFGDMLSNGIKRAYVMVRHEPCRNTPSIEFCREFGFRYTGEEVEREGIVHGVYERVFD